MSRVTGVVRGQTIALDEGQRVRVVLEAVPSVESEPSVDEQSRLLREWAQRGPKGPLDADEAWPDES